MLNTIRTAQAEDWVSSGVVCHFDKIFERIFALSTSIEVSGQAQGG